MKEVMKKEKKRDARKPRPQREKLQKEVSGIVLLAVSLFLMSAILTFHPDDFGAISGLTWYDMFSNEAKAAAGSIHSPFGLLGARLSSFFIRSVIGYPMLLPLVSVSYWGWSLLRHRSLKPALFFFLYAIFVSLVVATMFGLTAWPVSDYLAGAVGRMLASFLSTLIGVAGAWSVLLLLAIVPTAYLGSNLLARIGRHSGEAARAAGRSAGNMGSRVGAFLRRQRKPKAGQGEPPEGPQADAGPLEAPAPPSEPQPSDAPPWDEGPRATPFDPSPDPVAGPTEEPARQWQQPDPSFPEHAEAAAAGEPEMIIRQSVHEQEADLDERKLKVQTRDRVPYRFPSIDLLDRVPEDDEGIDESHLEESKRRLLEKLNIYKIDVVRISTTVGPRVTLFEMELAPDVKISRVKALENDLAMALAARGIRIIAPIPGKNAVGVEIPNGKPKTVWLRSVFQVERFKNSRMMLPIVLGRTISNEVYIDDLTAMPHLLIAGATGAGKSVGVNVILTSLLYSCSPDKVKFVLIDPKRVELFHYQHLKNHFLVKFPGIDEQIITEPQKAVYALKCVEKEMEYRYISLEKAGVRNIGDYNRRHPDEALPYLVVVIEELADLMITAGREVEEPITRLAQLARAVGIHLVVATQRPSVDIITGIIKANFPSRIAYQVASKVDSRTILDGAGAEQLLGNGDMLFQPSSLPKAIRIQGPYVSSAEVEKVTEFIGQQHALKNIYMLPEAELSKGGSSQQGGVQDKDGRDPMFEDAARLVVGDQLASVSLLQRRMRLGFSRAGRVMDQLERAGIVGPADGSKAREVLVGSEESLDLLLNNLE